jgi:hypothetical protein
MRFADYIARLSFSVWQPDVERPGDRRLIVPRRTADDAKLVELPQAPIDVLNAKLPDGHESLYETVGSLCRMPRMSTFAMGTIINRAVAAMPPGHSYLNVGTWHGFSLMAGMVGNPDKSCVGIDNFSEFGGPREAFLEKFAGLAGPNHKFHEMDYRDYFARVHEGPIGVYLYDGEHSYENQLRGLQEAEPFFGEECIVLVDDTNWQEPYEATYDFVAGSDREYELLLDRRTAGNAHPSYWNGLLIFYSRARKPTIAAPQGVPRPRVRLSKHYDSVDLDKQAPVVSLVLHSRGSSPERLEAAIAEALAQRGLSIEVVVADEQPGAETGKVIASYGDSIAYISGNGAAGDTALANAVDATQGDYVAFADAETELRPNAALMGLAFPSMMEFNLATGERAVARLERGLALMDEVLTVVPPGSSYVVANGQVAVPRIETGREAIPFIEGATTKKASPPDDDSAIDRLEQLRSAGRDFLVLGWPAFDWLERYPRFRDHLAATATRTLESDNVIVFDLRR